MRYAEFIRFENDLIVEIQTIWDIPELMIQAKAWPLAPSLGREMLIPGPLHSMELFPGPITVLKLHAVANIL